MGAVGVSLGGAALLLGERPAAVDALVLEAVYPTIDLALANRLRVWFGRRAAALVGVMAVSMARLLMPAMLGVRWDALRPVDRVGASSAPVLVMAGDADRETPPDETEALFARAQEPKALLFFPGAGHVDLEAFDPERYRDAVLPFLDRHLRCAGAARRDQAEGEAA